SRVTKAHKMTARVSFFFSSRRRHTRSDRDWSSDVCSSDLLERGEHIRLVAENADHENVAIRVARGHEARHLETGNIGQPEVDQRSEERRVGKECRCRWSAEQ